jgi:hypothetical protein
MKKVIVASILGLAGSVATTYGQGIILFDNYDSTTFQPVLYGSGVTGQAAGANVNNASATISLLYALGTYSSVSSFLAAATTVATTPIDPTKNNPNAGFGGTGPGGYYDDGTAVVLPGWTTSATATFLTEGSLLNGSQPLSGMSSLWTEVVDPGYATASLTGFGIVPQAVLVAGFMNGGPTELTLSPVPEPTTLALAGLGGLASLVALRRKQA